MNTNLARPYSPAPSPPRSSEMIFSALAQTDFLFTGTITPVIVCHPFRKGLSLQWSLSRNLTQTEVQNGVADSEFDGSFILTPDMQNLPAGFYDLRVKIHLTDTEFIAGTTTFGWNALQEKLVETCPADFVQFWEQQRDLLQKVPLDLKFSLEKTLCGEEVDRYNLASAGLPAHYDEAGEKYATVELYKVNFASARGRVYGWFCKPPGTGPFPALLILPGGGTGPRPAPVEHARHGYATLDIQVHGFDVDLAPDQYERLSSAGDKDWSAVECYSALPVYLNALRSVDALLALPDVDAHRLAVAGGSQGGRLAVVVAALDARMRAAVPAITHYAYRPYVRWAEAQIAAQELGANFDAEAVIRDEQTRVESYYDVVNFAPLVRCPVLMNAGLIDKISSPTGVFAVYRALQSSKEIVPLPNFGHDWSPAFDRKAWRWLERVLSG